MNIHISQGYEKGIGIEVLCKALQMLCCPQSFKKIILYGDQSSFELQLKSLNINYSFNSGALKLGSTSYSFIQCDSTNSKSLANSALDQALASIRDGDLLITQPSRKTDLSFEGSVCTGHTDYFRKHYTDDNIIMTFLGARADVALLTEHINLSQVAGKISPEKIVNKVTNLVEGLSLVKKNSVRNFYFSGINPHCGETEGSVEKKIFEKAINILSKKYAKLSFFGPFAGDTLHLKAGPDNILIYTAHDQGLSFFKSFNGFLGVNATLGLPFLRLSVDHGTAEDIYLKNSADPLPMYFLLKMALAV